MLQNCSYSVNQTLALSFKIMAATELVFFPICVWCSRHGLFYSVYRSYYGSPLPTAMSIIVVHHSPVTAEVILWTAVPPQACSQLHLTELFYHWWFFLKWWKRNIIMSDSCGCSGMKSLHLFFSNWEKWWLKERHPPSKCNWLAPFAWIFPVVSSITKTRILIQKTADHLGNSLSPQSCTRKI